MVNLNKIESRNEAIDIPRYRSRSPVLVVAWWGYGDFAPSGLLQNILKPLESFFHSPRTFQPDFVDPRSYLWLVVMRFLTCWKRVDMGLWTEKTHNTNQVGMYEIQNKWQARRMEMNSVKCHCTKPIVEAYIWKGASRRGNQTLPLYGWRIQRYLRIHNHACVDPGIFGSIRQQTWKCFGLVLPRELTTLTPRIIYCEIVRAWHHYVADVLLSQRQAQCSQD